MNKNRLQNCEWKVLIYVFLLLVVGLVALYSATTSTELAEFKKQIIWIAIGIPILCITMIIDYKLFARFSIVFYVISIILLGFVLLTGKINGASSWFSIGSFSLQPGEFAKVAVILFVANIMSKMGQNQEREVNKITNILKIVGIVLLPVVLIVLEPDYGTATAYIFALVFMLFVAGIDKRYIIIAITILVITIPLLYLFVLPEHAKARIEVYIDPYKDPRGDGYNIIQSEIAIGAGQLLGLGFLQGTQTHLGYLYPKTTDFIYSVIGEEFGFAICSAIVIVYVLLVTKCINIAKTAQDNLGSYIAIGVSGVLFFHILENIGMTIGLLPITGVPLPFISYGGSSMLTNMMMIGLILNVSSYRQKSMFKN